MFKNKPRKNRAEFLRSSKLHFENLEERQLLTAVGAFDVPYGPDPAPIVCTAASEVDDSPVVDLTSVVANAESELVLVTTGNTLEVTTTANDGAGSLRAAISSASAGDTITFADSLKGATITLGRSLEIGKSLTINASRLYENGKPGITINGAQEDNVIYVCTEGLVVLNGLTITNGKTDFGGGIRLDSGKLETINTTISGNYVEIGGGGVYVGSYAKYTSTNTTISGNYAEGGERGMAAFTSIRTQNIRRQTRRSREIRLLSTGAACALVRMVHIRL